MDHEEDRKREWPAPLPPEMAEHERRRQEKVRQLVKKIRPHAPFFNMGPDYKATAEFHIAVALLESVGDALALESVSPGYPDPPDVVGRQQDGSLVAIEVTELVDEESVRRNVPAWRASEGEDYIERGKRLVYREWDKPMLIAAIEERLRAKDIVTLHGAPFARYVVALHTDETTLPHATVEEWLRGHTFERIQQVTEAYLLFSPGLEGDECTHIRLHVRALRAEATSLSVPASQES